MAKVGAIDLHAPRYPQIHVTIDKSDKKTHAIQGRVLTALMEAGVPKEARVEFLDDIKWAAGRDEALAVAGNWVAVNP